MPHVSETVEKKKCVCGAEALWLFLTECELGSAKLIPAGSLKSLMTVHQAFSFHSQMKVAVGIAEGIPRESSASFEQDTKLG